jgi:hypothetical protein
MNIAAGWACSTSFVISSSGSFAARLVAASMLVGPNGEAACAAAQASDNANARISARGAMQRFMSAPENRIAAIALF